mgnify:FL=1
MSVSGGQCQSNSQCGPCATCVNGYCKYNCVEGQICVNGACVYPTTSNSISISTNTSTCAGVPIAVSIEATFSSLPYTGNINIVVINESSHVTILSTQDYMTNGIAVYNITFNNAGPYGFFAQIDNTSITDGEVITAYPCSTCTTCGLSTQPAPYQPINPILLGAGIGLLGLGAIYLVSRK